MRPISPWLLALGAALVAGCTVGPDHARPEPPASPALRSGAFLRASQAEPGVPTARWWEGMNDAELSRLVEMGLRDAPRIEVAEARARQARAGLAQSRASMRPRVSASALYAHADLPDGALGLDASGNDLFNLGFDARWEVDLWGGRRRTVERSRAMADAEDARRADAEVTLSAEIARAYIGLRLQQARLALLDRRLAAETRLTALARRRHAGGTISRIPVEYALEQAERTEAERTAAQADIDVHQDALAVLVGQAPGALATGPGDIPLPPASVAIGDPAAMLARRPDIRAAERQLAAANAQIGVEAARGLPRVSLLGLIGIGGSSAGDVFDPSQLATAALPQLNWTFLDFGASAAAKRGAEAGRDAARGAYREAVLSALQDAEAALTRYGAARRTLGRAAGILAHAGERGRLQDRRAAAGTASRMDALEAERQAIDARLAEVGARSDLSLAYVSLAKALGLGWQDRP